MKTWQQILLMVFMLTFWIGCDQVTKTIAQNNLQFAPSVSLLNGMVHLIYAENPGVAFSMGADLSETARFWIFIVASGVLLVGLFVYVLFRHPLHRLELFGYSLVLGGGTSNLLDRIFHNGHVIDFMMIQVGVLNTAIFNLADVSILSGITLLAIHIWYGSRTISDSPETPLAEA